MTLMSGSEILSLREAAELARVRHETIRQWCIKFGIGNFEDDRWRVRKSDLLRVQRARRILGK